MHPRGCVILRGSSPGRRRTPARDARARPVKFPRARRQRPYREAAGIIDKEVPMTHRTMPATAAPVGPATPLDAAGWAV